MDTPDSPSDPSIGSVDAATAPAPAPKEPDTAAAPVFAEEPKVEPGQPRLPEAAGAIGAETPPAPQGFDAFGLPQPVREALRALGYEAPTPIQAECIPYILAGRDILGQAQTGTGKTAAFAVPLVSRIDLDQADPQVLVLTPTRELALQVAEAFHSYGRGLPGFQVLPIYGGQSFGVQIRQLQRGAHVIVGTPGRVMDHMRQGYLSLERIRTLVLDEADEMLNMGFADDIEWIFDQAPAERQVALFSATMPNAIRRVAEAHLTDPVHVRVAAKTATVDTIEQHHCVVTGYHKIDVLTRVLEVEPFDAMLVFVRTKNATLEVAEKLTAHGFSAEALNGDMTQEARERAITRLKNGRLDILVATDVAARGLDVERISHVVNYDIPTDPEAYVHRVGRTGRAGRAGKALLFVQPRERNMLFAIERTIRQRIPPLAPPSAEQVSEHRIDRLIVQLRTTKAEQDLDFFYGLVARIEQEQEMSLLDVAATLTYLIQRERPLEIREDQPAAQREPRPERRDGMQGPDRGPGRRPEAQDRPAGNRGERPYRERGATDRPYRPRDEGREYPKERGQNFGPSQGMEQGRWRPYRDEALQPRQGPAEYPRRERAGEGGPRPADAYRARRPDAEPGQAPSRPRPEPDGNRRDDRPPRPPFQRDGGDRPFRPRGEVGTFDSDRGAPRDQRPRADSVPMVHYRIEVGRRDGVTPREIVGAIANEGGIDGRHIGRIDIEDDHCTLDLPDGMPREIQQHLRKVRVCGRPLNLTQIERGPQTGDRPPPPRRPRKPRPD
jgi:ATP-dependent RNA helicase DeaD